MLRFRPDEGCSQHRVARATANPYAIAIALLSVGQWAMLTGDYARAHAGYAEAATLLRQMRDRGGYNVARSFVGHTLRLQDRYAEAAAVYAETLPVWQEVRHRAAVAYELECLAGMAVADGPASTQRAATLFGAAEALRERIGSTMTVMERGEYDQAVANLRAGAEPAVVEAAWARGRALGLDQAVGYALAEGSESPAPSRSP
jgi:hypothetical protein